MKRLEKKMTYGEVIFYLETHPKYNLPQYIVNETPFVGKLIEIDEYRFENSLESVSQSKLIKYPVYLEYSKEYKKELAEMLKHKDSTVVEFVKKYC